MDYPSGINGPVVPNVNLESLLASLCSVRQRLWEQRSRQGRALELLGFRQPQSTAGGAVNGAPHPAFTDAISVLAREVDYLSQTCAELTSHAEALEGQYSEKSSL